MIECFAFSHGLFWVVTLLLIISEVLGDTKLVKANGVLSFILNLIQVSLRTIRKILRK